MKRKLALIHTVNWYDKSVLEPFGREFAEQHPDVEIINIMDDSLLAESLPHGSPTPAVIRRMILYAMAAESAGADVIMCSCTTMGEATRIARRFISVPVFNIDEPMAREAVAAGERIGIIATVPTSAPATETLLIEEANRAGRRIQVETAVNEQAFRHLLAGEVEKHNTLVRQEIECMAPRVDVIALGQISLSKIQHQARVPILQVGRSGFAEARRLLSDGARA
ncbi:MAG TPA: aspartate/glutamate racemase family protein [Bryobacteraceae bacterium]|nr:aspartate/glutamate racemase family protein [Bryobacteraceae bacterium]